MYGSSYTEKFPSKSLSVFNLSSVIIDYTKIAYNKLVCSKEGLFMNTSIKASKECVSEISFPPLVYYLLSQVKSRPLHNQNKLNLKQ